MSGLKIGKVATQSGIGIDTIRFYEREGLIPEPPRRPSGFRDYSPDVVVRLRFIRRAKELGFSLKEIGDLLFLRVDEESTCEDVFKRATAKMADIEDKIRHLELMKSALAKMARACHGTGPAGECPFLEALHHETGGEAGAWQ